MDDMQSLLEAVNALINLRDCRYVVDALNAIATINQRYPVMFSGALALYNPLLQMKLTDPDSYANLQALIDRKREAAGLPLCWPPEEQKKFDKGEYQRQIMAVRRLRAGKAMEIENAQRTDRDRLVGNPRLEFERRILATWGKVLDKKLQQGRAANGGKLSKDHTNAIRAAFWDDLEAQLDEAEALVNSERLKPSHLRRHIPIPLTDAN